MKILFSILAFFGVTTAYAAEQSTGQGSLVSMLPMFLILIVLMYLLVIRPQTKRAKEHQQLVSNLTTGDEVVTSGGILGKISKIVDNVIVLEVAQGVEIKVQKSAVALNLPKGTVKVS